MKLSHDQGLPAVPYTASMTFWVLSDTSLDQMSRHYPESVLTPVAAETIPANGHFLCTQRELNALSKWLDSYPSDALGSIELYATVVRTDNDELGQAETEKYLYDLGFHLDPREWQQRDYAALHDSRGFISTTFRLIKQTGHPLCTLPNLLEERDLHMDMLREFSSRSDAHVYRYAFAQELIRPGDRVLDCACGLGYGSYLLSLNENASNVTAVDICKDSVAYANQVYGHAGLRYQSLDIDCYADTQFEPFDLITSFETIEHVRDYHSFFKLCLRSLKPDGRIIASVPYMWVDETGKDPNPYHFHEFDWDKFAALFAEYGLIIEARYQQAAPGGFKLPNAPRRFEQVAIEAGEVETEWLIVIATPDLTHSLWQPQQTLPYQNLQYPDAGKVKYLDFENGYDNPWLHRQLVQVGQRIEDSAVRQGYLRKLLRHTDDDKLMLLTLLGYTISRNDPEQPAWLSEAEGALNAYNGEIVENPFTLRWFVSLASLCASRHQSLGQHSEAAELFTRITALDCNDFCPVLNIKAIEAHYALAKVYLLQNKQSHAIQHLESGKSLIFKSTETFEKCVATGEDRQADFLWSEMAELYDAGALLNKMLIAIKNCVPRQGILRQAHTWEENKRFGLFNLIEKYRHTPERAYQADMQLIARSYINKLVDKLVNLPHYQRILIWGTGVVATEVCTALQKKNIEVMGFLDSSARDKQMLCSLPVMTPDKVPGLDPDTIVLTSVGSSAAMAESLSDIKAHLVYLA
ncbi:class I SAM-dependent methyltransferase [Alteromonas sp. ASW11-19]|uniref:Class I SAM-dependent methyltransferase n=1 Tax=Alteromonas salexigens TaxID=2982530 RepID=A0ABT2VT04_9ALTE|nr:class I SAM-dependent methyltransferase [Alteromonas salexigens]MCU7554999.1 class I SAM-dependent methyltransferase [Alteromonas salexigens]